MAREAQELGARIRVALDAAGVTLAAASAEFNVTEQVLSGWIRTGKIELRKLPQLSHLTGRSLDWLLTGDGEDATNPPTPSPLDLPAVAWAMNQLALASRDPLIRAQLGEGLAIELATVAAGFRQRYPHLWPNAQQQLPLA